jgi:hypothetical protein
MNSRLKSAPTILLLAEKSKVKIISATGQGMPTQGTSLTNTVNFDLKNDDIGGENCFF